MFLRNRFLNTTALYLAHDNEGGNETLTPEQERDAINVETSGGKKDQNATDDNENNNSGDEEKDEDDEDDEGEPDEEKDEDEEKPEETDEEKQIRVAAEKEAKKEREARREARKQKKWDRLAAERNALEAEVELLRKRITDTPTEGLTEAEVERRAEEKAAQKLAEQESARAKREFDKNCKELELSANKADPKFNDKLDEMIEELDRPIPGAVISILADLDNKNGGAVLNYLTDNLDEADDIFDLSPHRMTQKLVRISDKLKTKDAPKIKAKPLPAPLRTVREGGKPETNVLTGKEGMDDFVRIRERQQEQYRKSKGGW